MAGVRFQGITKSYGKGDPVLRGIDLEIRDGEFMVLVGPSGCGKSTILRAVAGLEPIDSGEIWIGDRQVNDIPPRERDIAMVFQSYALYPHMTVYDNIAFGLRVRRFPKGEIKPLVSEAAEILGLDRLLEKLPKQLSGGERQRVALGRAIVRKPKLFLFDEPLSNLDAKLRVQMRAEISALHHRLGITTLYVTHDQVEAMTMGERITVLKGGTIQQVDRPMGLYTDPANRFVGEFIGSPPMNILTAGTDGEKISLGGNNIPLGGAATRLSEYRGDILLGIRPEHVSVTEGGGEMRATVRLVEPMGGESILYLGFAGGILIATVEGIREYALGTEVAVSFDLGAAHFFDAQTERRIDKA